ncbi:MAG: prepilin-type N-terminal cleavage/methylation domain-containing protein [Planctomycetales bacterium]|nr:prepilin-type N-terminal cleavage/methylation domain-containing protein [Planctomycetales bacterium]
MFAFESSACPATLSTKSSAVKTHRRARRGFRTRGFTLLEVLIATAVTLLMMISLAQIFKVIGDSMQQGRSVLELNNRLRSVVYRLRSDLDNLTVVPAPPADPATGPGYLQVFDGSTTDYTAATKLTPLGGASRFGDVDDILMATVRAGDVWFTGKVPQFVLLKTAPDPTNTAHFNLISIASQHAEVAVFLQPLVSNDGNPNRDPAFFLTSPLKEAAYEDTDPFVGFPDSFRLYYRTLLIRPDLNLVSGVLPSGLDSNNIAWLKSVALSGSPSPLCDMALAHQQCDLSMRRVYNASNEIAANSLEDLTDPANRFAHVQVPLPGTVSTTMPVLALGARLAVNAGDPSGTLQVGSGFLHPAFVLRGVRTGEDLLASDVLAFDIKLFDPEVPLLGTQGGDGIYGITGAPGEVGWAGSDDLILSPNDPGYAAALIGTHQLVGTGEYVDLAWAKKLVDHGGLISATTNVWSPLSGFSQANFNINGAVGAYTYALFKSGSVLMAGSNLHLLQPTYDTYTTRYEGDGVLQAELTSRAGVCRVNGAISLYPGFSGDDSSNLSENWRVPDAGTDGIDNVGSLAGVDDTLELETSPPFPIPLRGLKISVRMEDPTTRQVKQMSATKEFVSQ